MSKKDDDLSDDKRAAHKASRKRRRRRRLIGLGIPTVAAGGLAIMLEVPWYLVVGFCGLVALAIFFET